MSCPLTCAHTSGAGCRCRLQPTLPNSIAAPSGSNTAPRAIAWKRPFERRFKGEERKVGCSGSFLHAAFADARRANAHVLLHAVDHPAHAPQIRIPPPPPRIVRVADHVPTVRPLAAQLTLHRHIRSFNLAKNMPNSSFSFYQTLTSLQSTVYSARFRPNTPGLTFPLEPHMTDAHASGVSISTSDLFRESWRLLRGHARLFVLLMGVAILAQLLAVLLMALVIVPMRPGESLREVWLATDAWRKVAVTVLFLATLAVIYRALAASVFAAAEIRRGRSVSVLQALGHVRRKQLRLFWLILLVSFLA